MAIKICLDAGHYGKYNRCPGIPAYYESEMNWKLHGLLKKELEKFGISVTTTRAAQDRDLDLVSRGRASAGCDLFLSIHSNAVGSEMNEQVDYPVVHVQLDGRGDALGKKLADTITRAMDTRQAGYIKTRKGNHGEYYGVLRGAAAVGTVGMILEHSFHTNTRSTKWLMDDQNLATLAAAEAKVIGEYFGLTAQPEALYRVQIGAYTQKANAERQLERAKAAGFSDAFITVSEGQP